MNKNSTLIYFYNSTQPEENLKFDYVRMLSFETILRRRFNRIKKAKFNTPKIKVLDLIMSKGF